MIAAANSVIIKACLTCIPFSVNEIAIAHAIGFEAGLLSFEAGLLGFVVRLLKFFPPPGRR